MSVLLLIAPSSAGKTEHVLRSLRTVHSLHTVQVTLGDATSLPRQPILVVPTPKQARSARERIAALGGALGVRIFTFDQLFDWILARSGVDCTELPETARFRLMRDLLGRLADEGALRHYHTIAHTPGMATIMLRLVAELQNACVDPAALLDFWRAPSSGSVPTPNRLLDIGVLYDAWERMLVQRGFVDRAGVGMLALDALGPDKTTLDASATHFYFDGFDFLTELQVQSLAALAQLPGAELTITLTGNPATLGTRVASNNRFDATRMRLEAALHVRAQPLPAIADTPGAPPALLALRRRLNAPEVEMAPIDDPANVVAFLEASQRTTEVRAALRWLKRAIATKGISASECALLVRDLTPWRATIVQVASEFGVPVQIVGGLPLEQNPAIVALLALLKFAIPDATGRPAFFRDDLVALLRSPYFNFAPLGLQPNDADRLDAFARAALVVGGIDQWRTAFATALGAPDLEANIADTNGGEEELGLPAALYAHADITRFSAFIDRLSTRLAPPVLAPMREQIAWLESLLDDGDETGSGGLGYMTCLRLGDDHARARDESALLAFKGLLRGLLLSAEQLGAPPFSYAEFLREMGSALEATLYELPAPAESVFCGNIVQARGLPFSHVAIMGMVEGELPQRTQDDPILRDEDRLALRTRFPGVQRATESQEREFFVEAISHAERALLLTRPVIGENGSAAEPSPYWNEMRTWLKQTPLSERAGALPDAGLAASMPELMQALAQHQHPAAEGWVAFRHPLALRAVETASRIFRRRSHRERTPRERSDAGHAIFDGDLSGEPALLATHFPANREWSPTAFETWLTCPYHYLTSRHLRLEPPAEPEAEVSRATIGAIYHEVLQRLYSPTGAPDSALDRMDGVVDLVLAGAPEQYRFLNTSIWRQQAAEMRANLRKTVETLESLEGVPFAVEQSYRGASALAVASETGDFRIRGVVDRIDALPDGTLRIIDYKTGITSYDAWQALAQGKRLQLPLYALMVEGAPGQDKVGDGIYFFAHKGEAANWSLAGYPDGIEAATQTALNWARRAVQGIRSGDFVPTPPAGGCPEYCPAAAFCWHYKPSGFRP